MSGADPKRLARSRATTEVVAGTCLDEASLSAAMRGVDQARRRCGGGAPIPGCCITPFKPATYASEGYRSRLAQYGITSSMSRRGNCYDNVVMKSWFSTVKSEQGERFESYAHAKESLFDYIEVSYNQRRRHSTLGHISPAEFERRSARAA
jgi:putative transposase